MMKITVRRTFNLGNYETLSVEATGEHDNVYYARLFADQLVLETAQAEMVRIFGIRSQNISNNPWDQVCMELAGVKTELGHNL